MVSTVKLLLEKLQFLIYVDYVHKGLNNTDFLFMNKRSKVRCSRCVMVRRSVPRYWCGLSGGVFVVHGRTPHTPAQAVDGLMDSCCEDWPPDCNTVRALISSAVAARRRGWNKYTVSESGLILSLFQPYYNQ